MKTEAQVVTEQPNPVEYITVAEVRKTLRISKPWVAQMVRPVEAVRRRGGFERDLGSLREGASTSKEILKSASHTKGLLTTLVSAKPIDLEGWDESHLK